MDPNPERSEVCGDRAVSSAYGRVTQRESWPQQSPKAPLQFKITSFICSQFKFYFSRPNHEHPSPSLPIAANRFLPWGGKQTLFGKVISFWLCKILKNFTFLVIG